ncbi:MAG TPA: PstS family phosphate ABC transporter substrate-binding protein [Actinomycetota bacterium]|nr:PstS family phosphate ABC transporter substrate-binding protein [Actinomycetota bacterium]
MRKVPRFGSIAIAAVAVVVLAAACSSKASPGNDGTQLSGQVIVSGSSTVQPISSLVAEQFSGENPGVSIKVDGPGTGDGFALFCKGETDISDASRPIKDEEKAACQQAGISYAELKVGLDGITVMTNPANGAVTCLSKADLYSLVGPESTGFDKWSDANTLDKQLGGKNNFPNVPLVITAPGEESGTYDAFVELALKNIAEERGKDDTSTRPDYQSSGNDNVIIQGIEGSPTSFGWVGFAYAEQNASGVKILQVDGGDGCVTPNRETIADGSYPLSRALYIYVNTTKAKANPALKAYVDYFVQNLKQVVADAGYVDLPQDQITATQQAWQSAAV